MAKPEDTPGKGKEDAPGQTLPGKAEPKAAGALAPLDPAEEKQGEAFTPDQIEEIESGEYPTPGKVEEGESKEDLQEEQEKRIEEGDQGAALGKG